MKTLILTVLSACGAGDGPRPHADPLPSAAPGEPATIRYEFENRGAGEYEEDPWLAVLSADEGESCVTSWMTNFLPPWEFGMESFPIPTEPHAGMVYAIPEEIPSVSSDVPFFFPPTFYFGGDVLAWFGGTWSFEEWSEEGDGVKVVLTGGVTCEYDTGTYYALPETCIADSGTITIEDWGDDPSLELVDDGYRGYAAAAIDPRSGDLLCQRISSGPIPEEGSE